ncbi:two-component response regulator [Hydrogenimonas sp.]|nr:two-component response regulator [Hydrogenimonas sp.]
MSRSFSLSTKIIVAVILFFLAALGTITYFNYTSMQSFAKNSEREKSEQLINSIEPVISINMFLGMDDPMREYLEKITETTPMILKLTVRDSGGKAHYSYTSPRYGTQSISPIEIRHTIRDKILKKPIGEIEMVYSNAKYSEILNEYKHFSFQLLLAALALVLLLAIMLKKALTPLRKLAKELKSYEPSKSNFPKERIEGDGEINIIQNAVIEMIKKIESYTDAMFKLNLELEMKVRERTKTIEQKNEQLKREIEERRRAEEALKYANRMLEKLSTTDSLTGLYNRRVFEQSLKKYWKTALREKQPISMILCDIDHFKKINDTYGHQAGDRCLKEFAQILRQCISRPMDIVARYGGEEFVFILPDTPLQGAVTIANEIQARLRERNEDYRTKIKMTTSIGISSTLPIEIDKGHILMREADKALYEAKERGRNRIVVNPLE